MAWPPRHCRLSLFALFLLLCAAAPARAAEDGKPAEEAKAPAAGKEEAPPARKPPETLLELVVAGGPLNIAFLSVLGLFSLIALAVILERLVNLTEGKLIPPGFVRELQELVRRREADPQPFRELCEKYPSLIANVLKAGLLRAGRPVPEVEKGMEDVAARELGALRARVKPLTVLASVGPLVGLLGTSVGMIVVFRNATQYGTGRAEFLAEGIYLKLMTTVGGLIVAIPSVLFGAFLNSRSEKLLRKVDECLTETVPCFARMERERAGRREEVDAIDRLAGRAFDREEVDAIDRLTGTKND